MSDRRRTFEPGSRVGAYEILEWIGAGGMGEVYRARDTRVDRQVALKVLPEEFFENEERRARFAREARVLASLNHPGIAVLYSFEEIGARHLIVMELVEGQSLAERLASGPLRFEECLSCAIQMAEALEAAHEKGIVHRDLKPANVMIGPRGRLKVLDFGLAKMLFPETPGATAGPTLTALPTADGVVMGTIAYMSPEQASGRPVDFRSDVFALGSILYEMSAGAAPFARASAAETLAAILKEEPASPGKTRPGLPAAFDSIVRRCLAKNPGDRYASMRDLGEDLVRARQAAPDGLGSPEPAARRARLAWVTAGATLLGLLVFAVVFLAVRAPRTRPAAPAPAPTRLTQLTDSLGLDTFPTFSPDGTQIAYCSDREGSFEIYVRQLTREGREIRITSNGYDNYEPDWSPDGSRIAFASRGVPGVWVIPALGGEPRRLTSFGGHPAWAPDGGTIAFQSGVVADMSTTNPGAAPPSSLWLVAAAGGDPVPLTRPGAPPGGHGSPVFSPDGNEVVFAVWPQIWSVSRKDGSVRRILPRKEDEGAGASRRLYFDPAFSPKGDFLYSAGRDESLLNTSLWRSRAPDRPGGSWGALERVTPDGTAWLRHVAVSRAGKIAYAALSTTSNLWSCPLDSKSSLPSGAAAPLTRFAGARAMMPRFSPDGRTIAFVLQRASTSLEICIVNAGGGDTRPLTLGHGASYPAWLPDGSRIAFFTRRDGKRGIWVISLEGRTESLLLPLADNMQWPALSPDGKLLAYWTDAPDRELSTWVAPLDGGPARRVTPPDVSAAYPRWSPDGRTLAVEVHREPDWVLATVPATGGPPSMLVEEKGQSWPYDFSPDGERISFAGQRDGIWNLYWVARKARTVRRLTDNTQRRTFLRYPAWSPPGDQIVYERSETTGNIWLLDPAK